LSLAHTTRLREYGMPELKAPPKPTWKGTPPNLAAKFVEFARFHHTQARVVRRDQIERKIASHEENKRYYLEDSASYRERIVRYREDIASYQKALIPLDDLSRYDEGMIDLLDRPNLLGIRPDSRGGMLVHLRIYSDRADNEPVYLGDFEVGLRFIYSRDHGDMMVEVNQTDTHCRNHWSEGFSRSFHEDSASYGRLHFYEGDRRKQVVEGKFCDLLDAFTRIIVRRSTARGGCQSAEPEAPTWTGITPNLDEVLRRTLDLGLNEPMRGKINKATKELTSTQTSAAGLVSQIREVNRKLSQARAELAQMDAVPQDAGFNEDDAREQLRYITSLPGIMGVRFERYNGIDVPVLHVRASTLHRGRHYDVGDFEIMFRETRDTSSVVPVTLTRPSQSRYNTMYYHPDRRGYAGYNWFCFGQRGRELQGLFQEGEYGQFVQIALNTINWINTGDQPYIPEYYNEIPLDASWKPLSETIRQRPRRRRFRELVSSHLV
jgi:hypothetical protein